jgi:hypothetical protein
MTVKPGRAPKGRAGISAALLAAAAAMALTALPGCCGCCRLGPDPRRMGDPSPPIPAENEPTLVGEDAPIITSGSVVNLGIVAYPAGTPADGAAMHAWSAPKLRPPSHKLGYALGAEERRAIEADLQSYARKVRYKAANEKGRFVWHPPPGCTRDIGCVLSHIASRSQGDIKPIAERIKKRAREANLNLMDVATIIVGFVQSIRYEIPKDEPFGLLPPARVAYEKRGDCDSKALLGHMLLKAMGIESILLTSEAHKHAMLGIALPAPGTPFSHAGGRYAFTETTAKGSPIGHINPELLRPNDWKVVLVD